VSFVSKPVAHETCCCGATWHPSFVSVELVERDKAAFREAHAVCRNAWQRCPVCEGCGTVAPDFYSRLGVATTTLRGQCRACTGTGVIPRPVTAGVQAEEDRPDG
jgi:hypothetical protein